MKSLRSYTNFKRYLLDVFQERLKRNKRYSLRAYARDLGISVSRLSEVLNGNEKISTTSVYKIAHSLDLTEREVEHFVSIVKSKKKSDKAKHRSEAAPDENEQYLILKHDTEGLLSRWYYYPLLEILSLGTEISIPQIAKAIEVPERDIKEAILKLSSLGLIKKNKAGRWERQGELIYLENTQPPPQAGQFHHQILERGKKALSTQPTQNRKFVSSVFTLQKDMLEEAKRELESFTMKFIKKYGSNKNADAVYCMSAQLFEFARFDK